MKPVTKDKLRLVAAKAKEFSCFEISIKSAIGQILKINPNHT